MKTDYVVWETKEESNAFVLDQISNIDDEWEIVEGVPRAATFPSGATVSVDPDFPHDTMLIDAFETTASMTIISPRLKDYFDMHGVTKVEYLPITIIDHKGKPAAKYFILHPIDPVDALDVKASGAKWSISDDSMIGEIERIALDESKVDADLKLFKLKYLYDVIIVRRDLAKLMEAEAFTGIDWAELENFNR